MPMQPLPIDPLLPEIVARVRADADVILTATPGAGKTTRLPPELLEAVDGQVLVLQPRRMAAVAACARVCEERGWRIGGEAGYQVRFESRVGPSTRLIFMTDALLTRRLIDDPELKGVGLVVLDEFHERGLNQDLILGAIRELRELGSPVKLLVMSATLDLARLRACLPAASVIEVPGKVFPLSLRHATEPLSLKADAPFFDRVSEAVVRASAETSGDVLVFLPGTGEINRVSERLQGRVRRAVMALHGSLPLSEQQRVLRRSDESRVILATNVAEASVTVDGVDFVVDSGLHKVMEMNPHSGFSTLALRRIARFNARQRAGRAARQKEGICLRLWTAHEETTQPEEPVPEVQRADLSQALLWLAQLGVSDFAGFAWLDRPPEVLLARALAHLQALGALAPDRRLTDLGRRLARFPLEPRWGALLVEGDRLGIGPTAARVAALLNERDFAPQADVHAHTECDVRYRLQLLDEGSGNRTGVETVRNSVRQLERQLERGGHAGGRRDDDQIGRLLLTTQFDRLCRRRGGGERALMAGGRGVRLSPRSQVRESEFFVALQGVDLPGQADTSVGLASGYSKEFVLQILGDRVEATEDIYFDEDKGRFFARRLRSIAGLPIDDPVLTPVDPQALGDRLVDILCGRWEWLARRHERLGAWLARWRFLVAWEPALAAELTPERIRQTVEMAAFGRVSLDDILAQDLAALLESVLPREVVRALNGEAPARFTAPSGVSHPLLYGDEKTVFVEVRLQEVFGLLTTPRLAFGRAPVTFRLLGPNFRPVQVTSDLENFWRSGYFEVRKELRARYPKHSWPEDPYTARPEAKGRRRS
jgi:ATP-dependent helicase HrpB